MQKSPQAGRIAWISGIVISGLAIIETVYALYGRISAHQPTLLVGQPPYEIIPLFFAIPATLIIARHPRSVIGWLLMVPALTMVLSNGMSQYLQRFQDAPPPATLPIWIMIRFTGASWIGLIIPLVLIPHLFPTGRPVSSRWKWAIYLASGMCLFFFFWSSFTRIYQPDFASWQMINPIGFLPANFEQYVMLPWTFLLALLSVSGVVSLIVRYRRAGWVEREQMKWLLYAFALFTIAYLPGLILIPEKASTVWLEIANLLFFLAIPCVPIAITAAILRYHLFDIDVIIRQTLVFATLTGLLGLVYAGGIILLQTAFRSLTGQSSDLALVLTTLFIAALFTPLRQRVQEAIDRRFYRQKYNVDQALVEFAQTARSGTNLEALTSQCVDLVQRTLQPEQVSLWIQVKKPAGYSPAHQHPQP